MSGVTAAAAGDIGPLKRRKRTDSSPSGRNTVACCSNHHVHNDWNAKLFAGLQPFICSLDKAQHEDSAGDILNTVLYFSGLVGF
jgi:hypothetical protein